MLKTILYVGATLLGIGLTFQAPLWGAVLNISAYLMNPQLLATEMPGFRFQFCAAIALIVSVVMHRKKPVPAAGNEGWIFKALWVYVAISFLSGLWAVHSKEFAWTWAYDFSKTILVAALFLLVIRSKKDMGIIIWTCLIGTAHAAFMHVFGAKIGYLPPSVVAAGNESGAVIEYQGILMVLFCPLFILLGLYAKRWYGRLFCWLALPLVLDSIVNTYQRTVFVALAAQLVLLVLLLPKRLVFKMLPIIAFGLILFLFFFTPQTYWDWVNTVSDPTKEGSANSRFTIGQASLKMAVDYPLGVGYRNYLYVSPRYVAPELLTYVNGVGVRAAHNSYFSVLCETGFAGFGVWMAAIIGTLLVCRNLRKQANAQNPDHLTIYALGIEIGLYGWMIGGLFHSFHEMDPAIWFMAFAVVIKRLKHQESLQYEAASREESCDLNAVDAYETDTNPIGSGQGSQVHGPSPYPSLARIECSSP